MTTETKAKEEVFSSDLLFDFSEAFGRNKESNPRRDIELVFLDTCREFRIFGERQGKFFEVFATYRATVRIPEGIMERSRFLPEDVPLAMLPSVVAPVVPTIKKVGSLPRVLVRGDDTPDRHESQLPRKDRNSEN